MNESVQNYLNELSTAPATAIEKLVLGYAGVSAWSCSSLREAFVEIFETHAAMLDAAVTDWLQERLMQLPPARTPTLVWASHLQDLFSAVAGLPMPRVAQLLRNRLRDFRAWLRPLRAEESVDPESAYLAALAWADTNRDLEGLWHSLALRLDREPDHYTDIGLLGLRKLRDAHGQLPRKAPRLLLVTLIELADTDISQKEWLLTTRALLGGYHCGQDAWIREFKAVLATLPNAEHGPKWLRKVLPKLASGQRNQTGQIQDFFPTFTLAECKAVILEVKQRGVQANEIEEFLDRHRAYANATGNPHFLVRTFNRLAEAAQHHDPDWAIARAVEAMRWDQNHEFCWTALARAQWTRGVRANQAGDNATAEAACREALDTLWTARSRFPWNAYVRTELGRMHRDAGDLETAEVIYREAMVEFPQNPACHCGLAEVLAKSGRLEEAERLYREFGPRFPDNPYWRTGLAEILFLRSAARGNIAERDEARGLLREAAALNNSFARTRLSNFDPRWQRLAAGQHAADVEPASNEAIALPPTAPDQMRPAQRLGRALLLQWQARHAETPGERETRFEEAQVLLDLPDALTGECHSAFVEARGFLLLDRDQASAARDYFEQLAGNFIRPPLGVRLGLAEARARLGEPLDAAEEAELNSFGPKGSILPLVLKVVRLLASSEADEELRDMLLELYPRVRELAGLPAADLEEDEGVAASAAPGHPRESPESMVAQLLIETLFRPAAIHAVEDLHAMDAIPLFRDAFKSRQKDLVPVLREMAIAA